MLNKKILILIILSAFLLSISAVSANENVTDDVVSVEFTPDDIVSEDDSSDDIVGSIDIQDVNDENLTYESNDCLSLSISEEVEVLNSGSYLEPGSYGHIESDDTTIVYKNPIGYKVQLVGSYVSNQKVYFTVYDSDKQGKYVGKYQSITDYNGYATLNAKLDWGHYWIRISSDNHGSVYNAITVRPDTYSVVYISHSNAKYKKNNYISVTWWGILTGSLKIYKGSKLVKKLSLKTYCSDDDEVGYIWFDGYDYNTKKLSPGKYTVKVVDNHGKVVKKAKFKIIGKTKKTKTKKKKSSSKYKIIKTKAKMHEIKKRSGKFTVTTQIYDMTSGVYAPYKFVDTILYKNGKLVSNKKYSVNYKINGKWTGWKKYGIVSTAHHRNCVKDNAKVQKIKVKVHK